MPPSPSGPAVLAVIYTLNTIAAFLIAARIYLRLKLQKRTLQASDLLVVAAWCAAFTTASFDLVMYIKGILRADLDYRLVNYNGDVEQLEYLLKITWARLIPFFSTFYLCKASLLAVYLRLFPVFMRKRRITLWATIGYCAASYVATISLVLFMCFPIDRNWSISHPERLCDSDTRAILSQICWALHFFGSILLFALPFLIIHKLNMTTRTKVGVYSVFLLGLIDIAFSLTRLLTIQLSNAGDFRSITLIVLWSGLDACVGLIIACLPSLRPYLRRNPDKIYQGSSFGKSVRPSRSTPSHRPGQDGFEEMDDASYPNGNDGVEDVQPVRRQSDSSDFISNSACNYDKRSNKSDVELVNINASAPVREQVHV